MFSKQLPFCCWMPALFWIPGFRKNRLANDVFQIWLRKPLLYNGYLQKENTECFNLYITLCINKWWSLQTGTVQPCSCMLSIESMIIKIYYINNWYIRIGVSILKDIYQDSLISICTILNNLLLGIFYKL